MTTILPSIWYDPTVDRILLSRHSSGVVVVIVVVIGVVVVVVVVVVVCLMPFLTHAQLYHGNSMVGYQYYGSCIVHMYISEGSQYFQS